MAVKSPGRHKRHLDSRRFTAEVKDASELEGATRARNFDFKRANARTGQRCCSWVDPATSSSAKPALGRGATGKHGIRWGWVGLEFGN